MLLISINPCKVREILRYRVLRMLFDAYSGNAPQNPPLLAAPEPSANTAGCLYGLGGAAVMSATTIRKSNAMPSLAVVRRVMSVPPSLVMDAT